MYAVYDQGGGAWLSTLAVQHSLPLCSRDAHFEKVPQIARI